MIKESINSERRHFLSRLSKPVDAVRNEEVTPRTTPRPPRAVDEALFVRLCDGCGKCQTACPADIIEIRADLATLNMDYNQCNFCDLCVEACPTKALHPSQSARTDLRPVFLDGCDNYLGIDCNQCEKSCPEGAISVQEQELPELNSSLCTGCSLCRSGCYMSAISMQLS